MYVRPKLLWWLIPGFLCLFLIGMGLGTAGNRNTADRVTVTEAEVQKQMDRTTLAGLLDQLTEEHEHSFIVYIQDHALQGKYQRDRFQLSGEISGHKLEISRGDQGDVSVRIDGQPQDHQALPYALYTPSEHAALIKGVLHSVAPLPLQDLSGHGWRGFRLSVPPQEVTALLDMWLGPSFSIQEMTPDLAKRIAVDYQLWYDEDSGQLKQLEIALQVKTSAGEKRDQLRFRL